MDQRRRPAPAGGRMMGVDVSGRMKREDSGTGEWSRPGPSGAEPISSERAPAASEEGEHVVIGRLIRRLKISDPPGRFQALATNVLRTSIGVEAAAWVPAGDHEDVIVSGSVDGMTPRCFRVLGGSPRRDGVHLAPGPEAARAAHAPAAVRGFAAVGGGSAGALVVVNPADGRPIGPLELERAQYVASLIAAQSHNARIYADLKDLLFGVIRALTAAVDAKDPYTSGHSERVARIAVRIAEEMGFPPHKRSDLYLTGLLHDVGKIGIDDDVLKKMGDLTPDEYRRIQEHVEIGVTILRDLKKLRHILPGVRHHHESLDGSGYPDGLAGEEIPIEARILAVADAFDAMSSNRPYRRRLSPMQIDDIFAKGRGSQWDPEVVDALQACRMDVEAIRQKGLGDSLFGVVDVTLGRR